MKALFLLLVIGGCSVDTTATAFGGDSFGGRGVLTRGSGGQVGSDVAGHSGVGGVGGGNVGGGVEVLAETGGAGGLLGVAGAAGSATAGTAGMNGTAGAGGAPAYVPPKNCYTGQAWNGQNDGFMRPGSTCNSCHTFSVSGTVFVQANEPDNCYGVTGISGAAVLIVDATGNAIALRLNASGNFWTNAAVSFPITASTVYGSGQVTMRGQVMDGDCNSCHAADGFPGRVLPP